MATREQINICEKLIAGGGSCMREWCPSCPGSKPTKSSEFCTWCADDSLFGDPDPYVVIKARGWLDKNADSPQEDLPEGITEETAYRTSDGSVYTDRDKAISHEAYTQHQEKYKKHFDYFYNTLTFYCNNERITHLSTKQDDALAKAFNAWIVQSGLIK